MPMAAKTAHNYSLFIALANSSANRSTTARSETCSHQRAQKLIANRRQHRLLEDIPEAEQEHADELSQWLAT